MKIYAYDNITHEALANCELRIELQGEVSDALLVSTDDKGYFHLDDKYEGEELLLLMNGQEVAVLMAKDGTKVGVNAELVEIER